MQTKSILAHDLVEHSTVLDGNTRVRDLLAWFKTNANVHYVAVTDQGGLGGIVGRDQLNARLADKYGWSVLADRPLTTIMNPAPVIVEGSMELHSITHFLLNTPADGSDFYQDMVILKDGQFIGLASVKRLLYKQMEQIQVQMAAIERQAETLALKNQELVSTSLKLQDNEQELRQFFETCSVPLLELDGSNHFVQANRRFLRLLGYKAEELGPEIADTGLVRGGVAELQAAVIRNERAMGESKSIYFMVLRHKNGSEIGVEASMDVDEVRRRTVLSVLRVATEDELRLHLRLLREAEGKGALAQNIVSSIIDRGNDTTRMVRKVESMISVADKLEHADQSNTFNGDIADFSVTDLAQLLVMGSKTGQLGIQSDVFWGMAYFDRGRIVHAETVNKKGEAALFAMVGVKKGTFVFTYDERAPQVTIDEDPTTLLIRVCSGVDEGRGDSNTYRLDTESNSLTAVG
ncbi:MAG TPA: DUF4388 domain-containing protein [Verrucomicrobiae bacterium]